MQHACNEPGRGFSEVLSTVPSEGLADSSMVVPPRHWLACLGPDRCEQSGEESESVGGGAARGGGVSEQPLAVAVR